MTRADLIAACRYYINEESTETGALLEDDGNLLDFIHDATEDVILDLVPIMPGQLLKTETLTVTADDPTPSITTEDWLQVYKVERYVSGQSPKEIDIIDPLELASHTNVGETEADPNACYFIGDELYLVKTPSESKTYLRLWLVQGEPDEMAETGPAVIPSKAHRLIVYRAMLDIAPLVNADLRHFQFLYDKRLRKIERIWAGRYQQKPEFVRASHHARKTIDSRDKAFYDKSGFFGD